MNKVWCILIGSSVSLATADTQLKIARIMEPPSLETIQKALEAHGGTYTLECGRLVQELVHDILQGTSSYSDLSSNLADRTSPMHGFLSSTYGQSLTKKLLHRLNSYLPSLGYSTIAKKLLNAYQSTHQSIGLQKEIISQEDQYAASSPMLRTAHALALETVIRLIILMVSPSAHPCERMHALYLMNVVHLSGSQRVALERFRDRANRFYFTYEGTLRSYDPSKYASQDPKQIKAVDRFMKAISRCKNHYLYCLSQGIEHGITLLQPYRDAALRETWSTRHVGFGWRYAASLFKDMTSIDVIAMRTVPPEKIFAHACNKDFLALMTYCTITDPHLRQEAATHREKILNLYVDNRNTMGTIMKRYYHESCPQP